MSEPFTAAQEERIAEIMREALDAIVIDLRDRPFGGISSADFAERCATISRDAARRFAVLES